MMAALAPARPPVLSPLNAVGCRGAASRSSAAPVQLAWENLSGRRGRRSRAHPWRMVAAHGRDVGGARLFPSRDDERRALLALPSRRWGREHNGRSELVHPWRVRMTDRSAIPTPTYVEIKEIGKASCR